MDNDNRTVRITWIGDWKGRLMRALRARGYGSVAHFLTDHAELTYEQAAREIDEITAPLQIVVLQMDEAIDNDSYRDAAADALARVVLANMRKGWGMPPRFDSRAASALVSWISIVAPWAPPPGARSERRPMTEEDCRRIWKVLVEDVKPHQGWKPSGANDPYIREAFRLGLPAVFPQ
jgi:hypothetical protein